MLGYAMEMEADFVDARTPIVLEQVRRAIGAPPTAVRD